MSRTLAEDDFKEDELFTLPVQKPKPKSSGNPLAEYFRMPGVHIKLPTRGAFFDKDDYSPTLADDIAVYPMKASDELLLRSPDAMMSGYALESLIQSCVPSIANPRDVSTPDLDVILLAIRAATYGELMEIEVNCPKCGHENLFDANLPLMMSSMTYVDEINEVRLSDSVVVHLRPFSMASATRAALATFEEQRKLQAIEDEEVRRVAMNETFVRLSKINLDGIVDCIIFVATPSGVVTERPFISEFINNTSQRWVKQIDKKMEEMNNKGIDKHIDAKCGKCEHEWRPEIEFDPTNFFDPSS